MNRLLFSLWPTGLSQVSELLHHVVPSTVNYSGSSSGISLQSGFQRSNMLVIFLLLWLKIFSKKRKTDKRQTIEESVYLSLQCQRGYESLQQGRHGSRSMRPSWEAGSRLITLSLQAGSIKKKKNPQEVGPGFQVPSPSLRMHFL